MIPPTNADPPRGAPSPERSAAPVQDPYRALFEQSADAILIIDGETFVDCNQATVDMLRYSSRDELLSTHPSELSPPTQRDGRESFEKANEMIALAFERGSHRFEWEHVRADGEVFPVEVLLTAVPQGERVILHVVWRDITERKQLEMQLRQTQKMEAVGKLAGGIAHDFNNLLVAIIGNTELLRQELVDRPDLVELTGEIHGAAERAANLTRQLLAFSRKQILQPKVIDLNSVIEDLERLLGRLIGEDVRLVTDFHDGSLRVVVDPGQVEQVVVNLVTNARDAMPLGGTLTIETDHVIIDGRHTSLSDKLRHGPYARLSITDTGIGMSEEVAKRAFEPFFTTKSVGRGTGLGLSTVYGIVKQSRGEVLIESEASGGTRISVYLPMTWEELRETEAFEANAPALLRGHERIVVAEDEPAVSALVERVLRTHGYEVLLCADGRQALERIQRDEQSCDLLITDVVMPEMGGPELVERLRSKGLEPRVIFTSGYMDIASPRSGALEVGAVLLKKPFSPYELLRLVRQALDPC